MIASPYPSDNFIVRVSLRLASRFVTHKTTLPFWAGIIDYARGPQESIPRLHGRPRQQLSQARQAEIPEYLRQFANEICIHFKGFEWGGILGWEGVGIGDG
jgi:hypothetical protein